MRYLEAFRNAVNHPKDLLVDQRRKERYLALIQGLIERGELDPNLAITEDDQHSAITLPFPGPLYGLLRRMGFAQEDARRIADEEGAHFHQAVELGFEPRIEIDVLAEMNEEGMPTSEARQFAIHVVYALKGLTLASGELLNALRSVHIAPEEPSEFDRQIMALIDSQ